MSSTTKKRKSGASTSAVSKKVKLAATSQARAVETILSDPSDFHIPDDSDVIRATILGLAQYARGLEEQVDAMKPKAKSPKELQDAAVKLANAAKSGIRKQLTWKPSAKAGTARWMYDGVCSDPEVFGTLLNLGGPPTFKTKKIPKDEFGDLIGDLDVSIRYDVLRLTSDVNIHWKPDNGTFKFSGTYGK